MNKHSTVLFISHYAGRTGAPMLLLDMLRWLKANSDLKFEILLGKPGVLSTEFAALAPTHVYDYRQSSNFAIRVLRKLRLMKQAQALHRRHLLQRFRKVGVRLVYANTMTNGAVLEALSDLGCGVITHAHELTYWIEHSGEQNRNQVMQLTQRFIAASDAVKQNLVARYSVRAERIDVVHSFIHSRTRGNAEGIRAKLGIPEDAFVVLGSGHETWRKGKDIFLLLADQMRRFGMQRPVHFLWIGAWECWEDRVRVLHDVDLLRLGDRVHFTGEVGNPHDYFAAGDVFAMVSREDPFPLVCLEAASLGKPVVCFEGAGGMPEFVETDAGFVIALLDIAAMASKLRTLAEDEALRDALGAQAAAKTRNLYDVERGSRRVLEIIRSMTE